MTKIPTKSECLKILKDNSVPDNIIAHVSAVCDFSMKIVDNLESKGVKVNRKLVAAGALLHDVRKLSTNDHVIEGYELIKSLGYPEVAEIIKKHGLHLIGSGEFVPKTYEEKIVFYADKRVTHDKFVTLDERFRYLTQRYKKDRHEAEREMAFTRKIGEDIMGNSIL